ncbi:MAG: DUF460 domain-containing protein [Candidatus Aenigmatarchaeota archaeon]
MKVILGIDPGVITGIAIVDIKLEKIVVKSERNFSRDDIINFVLSFGDPIIVACDVSNPPKAVRRIASIFGAKLIYPRKNLDRKRKEKMIRRFSKYVRNNHERDALASSLYAYNKIIHIIRKINKIVNNETMAEEVLAKIIKEKRVGNIKQVLLRIKNSNSLKL